MPHAEAFLKYYQNHTIVRLFPNTNHTQVLGLCQYFEGTQHILKIFFGGFLDDIFKELVI